MFVFGLVDNCIAWGAVGSQAGAGGGFLAGGPILVAPGAAIGAGGGCLFGGLGAGFGFLEHQPIV